MIKFLLSLLLCLLPTIAFSQALTPTALKALLEDGDTLSESTLHSLVDSTMDVPRIVTADKIWAVKDETLQLFKRGLVECPDPRKFSIRFSGAADAYFQRNRYFHIPPTVNAEHTTFKIDVVNAAGVIVATQTTNLEVVTAVGQPSSDTRVLIIGDSLTANGSAAWVTEFNRLLTGSGGSPAGKAYSNITLIGTQGTGANLHEGHVGQTWQFHATPATSPFANAGGTALDFDYYCTDNSFAGIEQVYILLGWNTIGTTAKPLASDWATDVSYANTLIAAILADFPSAKITLLSLQCPALDVPYGNRDQYTLTRSVFGHKLAMKSIADGVHSASVDWIDLASQFDSDYNFPYSATAVNSRSATTELVASDYVHPATDGYEQIADACYRHFIGNWCQ